jgi:hypothetical protein
MNLTVLAALISAVAACAAAGAALWGLRYAKGLIDAAVSDRQVDRVLALHQSLTTGEVSAARTRFSSLMYRAGEVAFEPRKCWRPTWESLIPSSLEKVGGPQSPGFLSVYPEDMVHAQGHRPIDDIRQVLWCFDRINEARKREPSLDKQLLVSLMGHTAVWWNLLCGRLDPKQGAQLYSLVQLAAWMEESGWRNDPRNQYRKIPEGDFPGLEDSVPAPVISIYSRPNGQDHGGRGRVKHVSRGANAIPLPKEAKGG